MLAKNKTLRPIRRDDVPFIDARRGRFPYVRGPVPCAPLTRVFPAIVMCAWSLCLRLFFLGRPSGSTGIVFGARLSCLVRTGLDALYSPQSSACLICYTARPLVIQSSPTAASHFFHSHFLTPLFDYWVSLSLPPFSPTPRPVPLPYPTTCLEPDFEANSSCPIFPLHLSQAKWISRIPSWHRAVWVWMSSRFPIFIDCLTG